MRLPSWLAAFSVVVAIVAAAAFGVHAHASSAPAASSSKSRVGGFTEGLVALDDLLPSNRLNSPSIETASPTSQPPATRPPAPPGNPPSIVVGSAQQGFINRDRAAAGLGTLTWSSCLASIAAANAVRMARQGHISYSNGASLDLGCHLGGQQGENLGRWGGGIDDAQLNTMYMDSPEHRANIMGRYQYVGTAWAVAPNGYAYIAVEFS